MSLMTDRVHTGRIERWLLLLCIWPALTATGMAAEVLHFRAVLGRWPRPSLDDPKHQSFLALHGLIQFLAVTEPAIWLLFAFVFIRQWRLFIFSSTYRLLLIVFLAGIAISYALPVPWWAWFWD